MLFSITLPVGVIFKGLVAESGTYTPSSKFPEITFRSPTPGPPIVLDEFSISTPGLVSRAVSPVGSVPMKQPATWTLPPAVIRTPARSRNSRCRARNLRSLLVDRQCR